MNEARWDVIREMRPGEIRELALEFDCPRCGAPAGNSCVAIRGAPRVVAVLHSARFYSMWGALEKHIERTP